MNSRRRNTDTVTHVRFCACNISYIPIIFFFFFQAEDGIRDLTVTGVQTCALPISDPVRRYGIGLVAHGDAGFPVRFRPLEGRPDDALDPGRGIDLLGHVVVPGRSEERRVGKECRSRWSPYH